MPSSRSFPLTWGVIASTLLDILQRHEEGEVFEPFNIRQFLDHIIVRSRTRNALRGTAPACVLDGLVRLANECDDVSGKCGECILLLVGVAGGWERYGGMVKNMGLGKIVKMTPGVLTGSAWVEALEEAVEEKSDSEKLGVDWEWLIREVDCGGGEWGKVGDKLMVELVQIAVSKKVEVRNWKLVIQRVTGGFRRIGKELADLLWVLDNSNEMLGQFGTGLKSVLEANVFLKGTRIEDEAFFGFQMQQCIRKQEKSKISLDMLNDETLSLAKVAAICSHLLEEDQLGTMEDVFDAWITQSGRFELYARIAYALNPDHPLFAGFRSILSFDTNLVACEMGLPEALHSVVDEVLEEFLATLMFNCEELASLLSDGGRARKVGCQAELKRSIIGTAKQHPWLVRRRAKKISSVAITILSGLDDHQAMYKETNLHIVNSIMETLVQLPAVIVDDTVLRLSLNAAEVALSENRKVNGIPAHLDSLSLLLILSLKLLNQMFTLNSKEQVESLGKRLESSLLPDLKSLTNAGKGSRRACAAAQELLDRWEACLMHRHAAKDR